MTITLYEQVDIDRLNEVLNCDNIPFDERTDEQEWFDKIPKILLRYSKKKRTDRGIKTIYEQINKQGRHYTTIGAQFFQRDIRKYIMNYRDYDVSNAHPVILEQLFTRNGITDRFLIQYNENREKMILDCGFNSKYTVIQCINTENIPSNKNLVEFHKHIQDFINILLKDQSNKNLMNYIKKMRTKSKKHNFRGAFMAYYLQNIENDVLMVMMEYCNSIKVPVSILMFDGLGINPDFQLSELQIKEMETLIKNRSGFSLKITEKDTETDWVPNVVDRITVDLNGLNNSNEFSNKELKRLIALCSEKDDNDNSHFKEDLFDSLVIPYLSKYLVRFKNPVGMYGWRQNTDNDFQFIKIKPDIISISIWNAWLTSDTKTDYEKVVFIVDEKDPKLSQNVYNIYIRPEYSQDPDILEKAKIFFDFLYRVICGSDGILYNYLLTWIATVVQRGSTHQLLVLLGNMGAGKGSFLEVIVFIIGEKYFFTCNSVDRLTNRFNTGMEKAVITACDEVINNAGDFARIDGILKNLVTEKTQFIEGKGTNGYLIESNNNFILMTNGFNPYKITKDNRRACVIAVGDHEKQNAIYFIEMKKQVLQNLEGLRWYFKNLPIVNNLNSIRPTTNKELELLELNKSSAEKFIEKELDLETENRLMTVYTHYKIFSSQKGIRSFLDERYFVCCLKSYGYDVVNENDTNIIINSAVQDDNMENIDITSSGSYRVRVNQESQNISKTFKNKQEAQMWRDQNKP